MRCNCNVISPFKIFVLRGIAQDLQLELTVPRILDFSSRKALVKNG